MSMAFPFSAIVGQDDMKTAMLVTTIDPAIGGVLVFGDRGTGKSTAVRALAAVLPKMRAGVGRPVCPRWRGTRRRYSVAAGAIGATGAAGAEPPLSR